MTAACFAELGHEVYARDILEDKVESLNRGEVPIHEPGLPELLSKNRERLHFTTDMAETAEHAQLLFCCVDTPPTYSGDADLSRVDSVVHELGEAKENALVMKSTVPVGTGRAIQRRRAGLGYVSNPEFLKEGSAVADFMHPDRVVVGAGEASEHYADRIEALYGPLGSEVVRTDVASAEMIKLASNAFLATKISFINEIANVSEEVGADVIEVARGMGLDDRIGKKFLNAGIGWGGSCLHGSETVLVRHHGRTVLLTFDELWRRVEEDGDEQPQGSVIAPSRLEVLSWVPEARESLFLPVMCVTRRDYAGDLLTVHTKMGRRVRCTPDHPLLVTDGAGSDVRRVFAEDVSAEDWLPLSLEREAADHGSALASVLAALEPAAIAPEQVITRPGARTIQDLVARPITDPSVAFPRALSAAPRTGDVKRTVTLRLDEACLGGVPLANSTLGTATNGGFLSSVITLDERFWRVVGLYIAEGCCYATGSHQRLIWSFHLRRERHLVDEVVDFWRRHGLQARVHDTPTARQVVVHSRLLVTWWRGVLGSGSLT